MKTKIKRHYRSAVSILLSVCMLISCMTVGLIATDAARVDSERVGAISSWKIGSWDSSSDGKSQGGNAWTYTTMFSSSAGTYIVDRGSSATNANFYFKLKANNGSEHWACYDGTVIDNSEVTLGWDNEKQSTFAATKRYLKFSIRVDNNQNKLTVTESDTDPTDYYVHYGQTDNSYSNIGSTGYLIGTQGYDLSCTANQYYAFCINKSSSAKGNEIDPTSVTSTPAGSFTNTGEETSLDSNPCVKFKPKLTGTYNIKYSGGVVTITGPDVPVPANMYIVGDDYLGLNWTVGSFVSMTKSGSVFTWTSTEIAATETTYHFRLVDENSWSGDQYGWTQHSANAVDDTYIKTENYGNENNIKITIKQNCILTVTYDATTNAITVSGSPGTRSTLSIANNIADATVTATYNGVTKGENESLSNVPAGASVTINVVADDITQKCTGITTDPSATVTPSGTTWTLTMPAADTEITGVSLGPKTNKKVYFNNANTDYPMPYAYAWYGSADRSTITAEPCGKWPGKTMTREDNSRIWEVEVPEDCPYIIFGNGGAYNTYSNATVDDTPYYHVTIPWEDYDNPRYKPGKTASTPYVDGTWGNYLIRDNVYTLSDGTGMTPSNSLFTGINATFYDYYVDSEVNNGWLSIANDEKGHGTGWKWNPYKTLNSNLSQYATEESVAVPLYFGNLNVNNIDDYESGQKAVVEGYTNWNFKANNSEGLTNKPNGAVVGLSGKTLDKDNIHHYSASPAKTENGAIMAMFDEDFLSGENHDNKILATILRSASFPVRKENRPTYSTIYYDASAVSWYDNDSNKIYAYFWKNSTTNIKVEGTQTGALFAFDIPTGYEGQNVLFYRAASKNGTWNNKTGNLKVPTDENVKYTAAGSGDGNAAMAGTWGTHAGATATNHVYYEFDSQYGKDNAYVEGLNTTAKTGSIAYYNNNDTSNTANKVKSQDDKTYGFFPFDGNNGVNKTSAANGSIADDLGFGMKMEIDFTLEKNGMFSDGTHQVFDFSGDDDLWVFVDGNLVLDLGGAHGRTEGSIDFATRKITGTTTETTTNGAAASSRNQDFTWFDNTNPDQIHTMTLYYMERGMFDSNLKFGFSFHAVPNQLKTEKKVRTRDLDGHTGINAGFFLTNGQSGAASNRSTALSTDDKFVSQFQETYENDTFTIEHKVNNASISGKKYTKGANTYTVGSDSKYTVKNDELVAFKDEFSTGDTYDTVWIKEDASNAKYAYDTVLRVYDDGNNKQLFTTTTGTLAAGQVSGSNADGYQFLFKPTHIVEGGMNELNIRAQFTNYMKQHTLTLMKTTSPNDPQTDFTFRIKFKFGDFDYVSYPLNCDVTGNPAITQLAGDGTITVKSGQLITINKIPENALVEIEEINIHSTYNYSGMTLTGDGANTANTATISNGVRFAFKDDIDVTASNTKFSGFNVTKALKYSPSDGNLVDYNDMTTRFKIKVEESGDGTSWDALESKAFTSSDSTRSTDLSTDSSGMTYIRNGETLSFADIESGKYIRVTEDTQESTYTVTEGGVTDYTTYNHMPLDYQYLSTTAKIGGTDTNAGSFAEIKNTAGTTYDYQGCSFQVAGSRVDVTINNIKPRYRWVSQYNYTSRAKDIAGNTVASTVFGNLAYQSDGVFTAEELLEYTQFAKVTDTSSHTINGIVFKPDEGTNSPKANFLMKKSPSVDNFRETLDWNYKGASIDYIYDEAQGIQLSMSPSVNKADAQALSATFYFPCKMKWIDGSNKLVVDDAAANMQDDIPKASINDDGTPKSSGTYYHTESKIHTILYADWYTTNNKHVTDGAAAASNANFVTAPQVVYDSVEGVNKYFRYWSVRTMTNDPKDSIEFTRCYNNQFNFVFYQDANVYAVYGDEANAYDIARATENYATLTFLENSRNQWNRNSAGAEAVYGDGKAQWGDRVFSDFVIDLHYVDKNNKNLLLQSISDTTDYEAGVLIETVRDINEKEVDTVNRKMLVSDTHIANMYSPMENMDAKEAALTYLLSGSTDKTKYLNSPIALSKFDNKNELEFAYSFANISQTNAKQGDKYRKETVRKDKVYRAFAYLIHKNGGVDPSDNTTPVDVTIISEPVYFTIYDMAAQVSDYDVEMTIIS